MAHTTISLANVKLLRTLDAAELQEVSRHCSFHRVRAGEWVLELEQQGSSLYMVLRGHVRVVLTAARRDTILRDIRNSEFFGELAAIDGLPRAAGIKAVTDSELAALPAAEFRRLVHHHPDVCDQLLGVLAGQIRMLANRANEESVLDVRQRLWAELLRLARPPLLAGGPPVVSPPPTHSELAARINTRREAVTRELGSLERARLIERRRGAIALLDVARLGAMVENAG